VLAAGELPAARLLAARAEAAGGARNKADRMQEHLAAVVTLAGNNATGSWKAEATADAPAASRGGAAEVAAARCGLAALQQRPRLAAHGVHVVPWRRELWADLAMASA